MLHAGPTSRNLSRGASLQGFAASLLLCSVMLGAVNPCALGPVEWMCSERSETTEPNVEEGFHVVLTMPHSQRRGARQESPGVSALVRVPLTNSLRWRPAPGAQVPSVVSLDCIRMRC